MRLGSGHFDEPQQDRSGQRGARFIMSPCPLGQTELAGQISSAKFSEQLDAYLLKPARQGDVAVAVEGLG